MRTHPPPSECWTVAIHRGETVDSTLGTGFVIAPKRVLTAAHVVAQNGSWRDDLWVSFPLADDVPFDRRVRVRRCRPDVRARGADVAVLELMDDVPPVVRPARLRSPQAHDLRDARWWAFGFPDAAMHGADASGTIVSRLAFGRVRLNTERDRITRGFSGGALWSPDYEAVVGIIVEAGEGGEHDGQGHALTLYHVDRELPDLGIGAVASWSTEAADENALAAWGWSLRIDPECGRHWSPRARGVAVDSEGGDRFQGRTNALLRIKHWLDQPLSAEGVLVVTGSPGVGKSAVLGRIVTTADPEIVDALPADDKPIRATPGSVHCAVHVKGKTAVEVATEIAKAASVAIPTTAEDLPPALGARLAERAGRFNLVVDAVDEAASPIEARAIVTTLLVPLAEKVAGVQVVVGTRRSDAAGDLLDAFGPRASKVDLDDQEYFAEGDLLAYALATLRLVGDERPDNPYEDESLAAPVAQRIATMAARNFLVAGLVARTHGLRDTVPVDPARMVFTRTVDDALEAYVQGLGDDGRLALTALAFAENPGFPLSLWHAGIVALGGETTVDKLGDFARTSAANFLIESGADLATRSYRLFHQALNEALLRRRESVASDEGRLVDAWLRLGRDAGWDDAPQYLWRWLPAHAARGARIDRLLADDAYVLHADLRQLIAAGDTATTEPGRARARVLRLTPHALDAPPAERAAMLSVSEALDHCETRIAADDAPYAGRWANTPPRKALLVLEGHTDSVLGVCAVNVGERRVVASAGEDGTVRLWDPVTGEAEAVLEGHSDRVRAVSAVPLPDLTLLASASDDGTIGLWDPTTGDALRWLRGHADWVRAVGTATVGGRTLVVSAGDDRTVRLWDPQSGRLERVLSGPQLISWVTAVGSVTLGERTLLVSGAYDGTLTVWDPENGAVEHVLRGHTSWVTAIEPVNVDGSVGLASAGYDGTIRLWDVHTGHGRQIWAERDTPVTDLCVATSPTGDLLAWTSQDGTVRLHDPGDRIPHRELLGHNGRATGVCAVGGSLVASVGEDAMVRLWDVGTGQAGLVLDGGRVGPVVGLCAVTVDGTERIASTTDSGALRLWDAATGAPGLVLSGQHRREVLDVCALAVDDDPCVVSADQDGKVILWDATSGAERLRLDRHVDRAAAVCPVPKDRLASAGDDQTVRIWDLASGDLERELHGHTAWVHAVCAISDGTLVASASHDGTARVWDSLTGACQRVLAGHHGAVNGICTVPIDEGVVLATAGADALIRLWDPYTGRPLSTLEGHRAEVTAVCAAELGSSTVLVSASLDRTVRLWDPYAGSSLTTIPVHHRALSCCFAYHRLFIGLETGILAVDIGPGSVADVLPL